ncbi:DUF86 domain-containing protein [Iamia sp.]|uniref:HepT-like ribonuclease domain-containing protein n=1 Tax=Iamia sp. TaxID=2722710 RepID=UPI002D01031D|nr:HepT-like ribonuclease domain-containing protein [Iamia sp.]HXH59299.1 HepT-like ribonuclease domain-containing protein [Iamia sp.]
MRGRRPPHRARRASLRRRSCDPTGLERALEILGEAANHISEVGRADFPSVAWRDIVRLRIRLVHHYHRIEPALVWGIATRDVPLVAEELGPLTAGGDE